MNDHKRSFAGAALVEIFIDFAFLAKALFACLADGDLEGAVEDQAKSALGVVLDHASLRRGAAAILLGWALWHAMRGHRQRLRIGMQTGLAGLALWSFLMSGAHGAGLMLVPVLLPLCASRPAHAALPLAAAALGTHTAAMLATITAVSVVVYDWFGLAILRWGWINFDLIWVGSLTACGLLLLSA